MRYTLPLEPDCIYHFYARTNGAEILFRTRDNCQFFLERYRKYVHPLAVTFCYCLMTNHFHFLIRLRDENTLQEEYYKSSNNRLTKKEELSQWVSFRFGNLLNSYTKALNRQIGRSGNLFERPFKRIKVTDEKYFYRIVKYIHLNPVDSGLCSHPADYEFSSYADICNHRNDFLEIGEIIRWFGDIDNFKYYHKY